MSLIHIAVNWVRVNIDTGKCDIELLTISNTRKLFKCPISEGSSVKRLFCKLSATTRYNYIFHVADA